MDGSTASASDATATISPAPVDMVQQLCDWLPEGSGAVRQSGGTTAAPRLLYRGSRDGMTAEAFHRLCDDQGATVTVIRSKKGYVFGGYTAVTWKGTNNYSADASAFIYTLSNPVNQPAKYVPRPGISHAILCNRSIGPTFGGGYDITVYFAGQSYTSFGSYIDTTTRGDATFNGELYYDISDIEVWSV